MGTCLIILFKIGVNDKQSWLAFVHALQYGFDIMTYVIIHGIVSEKDAVSFRLLRAGEIWTLFKSCRDSILPTSKSLAKKIT